MPWPVCNSTLEDEAITEQPVWNGYTFHRIGLWISAITGIIAILVSAFLIFMHATHYLKPWEQRHIIRILFMVPIYAAVSFLSYYFYLHTVYFEVIRDCYEAFAIASFFALLCHYIAPTLHKQKVYFRGITPRNWVWPFPYFQKCTGGAENGKLRRPRSGLTWFNVIWTCVFQYCFIRVFMTIVAVITQALNRYCLESLNPAFSHIWVLCIEAAAVTVAMYCLIQFYIQIKGDIQSKKPLLKIAAIKLVIFLSFWQNLLISFLTSAGAIKSNDQFQTPDIKIGIPAMLLCIEMAIFSVFHLFAFSWKPYTIDSKEYLAESVPGEDNRSYSGGFLGLSAIIDAFNFWDLIKAVGRSGKWLFHGRRHRHGDESYLSHTNSSTDLGQQGQKLSNISGPTEYTGAKPVSSRPLQYSAGPDLGEGQNLLAHAQGMPESGPLRGEVSPYRASGGDIGVAKSSYTDMEERERMQEQEGYVQKSQTYQPYRPHDKSGTGGGEMKSFAEREMEAEERRGRKRPTLPDFEPPDLEFDPPPRTDSRNRRSAKGGGFI